MMDEVRAEGGRLAAWRSTKGRLVAILSLLLLALALNGLQLLSRAWGNAGLVVLTQALVHAPDAAAAPAALGAEVLLRQAVAWDAGNRSAHRGLGIIHTLLRRPQLALQEWRQGVSPEESEVWDRSLLYRAGTALDPGLNGGITNEWYAGGYFILDSFSSVVAWRPCPWCENTAGYFGAEQGVLEMSYRNTLGQRDVFAFTSTLDVPISDFSEMLLRIEGEPGTLLTVEMVVDGVRSRPFNYQPVPQEWRDWSTPASGDVLDHITIAIGEPPEPGSTPEDYRLRIDWIALR